MRELVQHKRRVVALLALCFFLAGVLLLLVFASQQVLMRSGYKGVVVNELYGDKTTLLAGPSDVLPLKNGQMFVTDADASCVYKLSKSGRVLERYDADTLMRAPAAIVLAEDSLFVSDPGADSVFELDFEGNLLRSFDFADAKPFALGLDSNTNTLVVGTNLGVAYQNLNDSNQNFELSAITSKDTSTASIVSDLAIGSDGSLYLAQNNQVKVYESLSATHTQWTRGFESLSGLALDSDEKQLYVLNSDAGKIETLNAKTGAREQNYLSEAQLELLYPQDLEYFKDSLMIADRYNARIISVSTEGPREDFLSEYVVVFPALMMVFSFGLLIRLTFIREPRISFDASACEQIPLKASAPSFAHLLKRIYVASPILELAHRAFIDIEIRPKEVKSEHLKELAKEYPNLDELDCAALALADSLRKGTFICGSDELATIARERGIVTMSLDDFLLLANQKAGQPARSINPHFKEHESGLNVLLMIAIVVLSGAIALLVSEPVFANDSAERITVSLLDSEKSASGQSDEVTSSQKAEATGSEAKSNDSKNPSHANATKNCLLCHGDSPGATNLARIKTKMSACEVCHMPASGRSNLAAYTRNQGSARNFSSLDSGHQIGLSRGIPNSSSSQKLYELSCYSCHSVALTDAKASCDSCHDHAVAETSGSRISRFEINDLTRAHQANASLYEKGHPSASGECYQCHRGDLDRGSSCAVCHYSSADFKVDPNRIAGTSDWPHASSGDRALLGNWEAVIDLDDENKVTTQYLTQPATLRKPQGELSQKAQSTSSYCARCHYTNDKKNMSLSIHDLVHDPATASGEFKISAPKTESIVATTSQGYIKTGKYQTGKLNMLVPEKGDVVTTYNEVSCTECHSTNVAAEHMLRSEKSCNICHLNINAQGETISGSYKAGLKKGVSTAAFASCGTLDSACHATDWHGNNRKRVIQKHTLPAEEIKGSCSAEQNGQPLCHAKGSSESLFNFGDMDLASAHNDYWSALNETHVTNTKHKDTVSPIEPVRGCGLCHSADSARVAQGLTIGSCADCHSQKKEPYALSLCMRADYEKLSSSEPTETLDPLEVAAKEYLADIKMTQEAARKEAQKNQVDPQGQGDKTRAVDFKIPARMLPTTQMMPLSHPLSIAGKIISGRSFIAENGFIGTLQNVN